MYFKLSLRKHPGSGTLSGYYRTWEKLNLTLLLLSVGFTADQAKLAAAQVESRAVYPACELETTRWIKENSPPIHAAARPGWFSTRASPRRKT